MNVLIVGSGGREYCLGWKIKQSPLCERLYFLPGNGGTINLGENIAGGVLDFEKIAQIAQEKRIDFVVVGPEAPLAKGLVDFLAQKGILAFGPRQELAQLESSKSYAKNLMRELGIPTAAFSEFCDYQKAQAYLKTQNYPLVVKADGLAAGKGVIIAKNQEEAQTALSEIMKDKKFGPAGDRVVVEEFLEGEEASLLVLTDGKSIIPLASSQDHKRAYDNDEGPNTGGMGAYSPAPVLEKEILERAIKEIFEPLIYGLRQKGLIYRGVLYGGLMIKKGRAYVLEFNVRFGDPETQAVLPRLESDLLLALLKTAQGKLEEVELKWSKKACVCVVAASGGYPGKYEKGKEIKGIDLAEKEGALVFHAGTKQEDNKIVTAGGRVLNVCALADSLSLAKEKSYQALGKIHFDSMFFRSDIADKALKREGGL